MTIGYSIFYKPWSSRTIGSLMKGIQGEWFNGKTAAFKVAVKEECQYQNHINILYGLCITPSTTR